MTLAQWEFFESQGLMRLRWEPDDEPYDDSYIDTWDVSLEERNNIRIQLWRDIERDGVWGLIGEYRVSTDSPWVQVDSVWGLIGQDDGGYRDDIRRTTYKEFAQL